MLALIGAGCTHESRPLAVDGRMDLTRWDFQRDGTVPLDGEWEIFRETLLTPETLAETRPKGEPITLPCPWNNRELNGKPLARRGHATFRLVVDIPGVEVPLALKTTDVASAHRVWINNREITSLGTVGKSIDDELPKQSLTIANFIPRQKRLVIVIQVSNHHHAAGGIRTSPVLGTADRLNKKQARQWAQLMALVGISMTIGVYHLAVFLFRRKERAPLYFGAFCLLIALNTLVSSSGGWFIDTLFTGLSWKLLYKTDLATLFTACPALVLFITSLFPDEDARGIVPGICITSALFMAVLTCTPVEIATHSLALYHVVIIFSSGYCCRVLILAVMHERWGGGWILGGFLFFALTGMNDILHENRLINSFYLVPAGLLILILSQSLVLARRFSSAFFTVENLSSELGIKNRELSKMDKLKDRFLADTSHELRTPLTGIIGISESLLAGVAGPLPKGAGEHMGLVVSSAKRLSSLVDDILDFSILENGDLKLRMRPVDIRALTDTVLTVSRLPAARKDLVIEERFPRRLPKVMGDENRLQQILYNLVGNAVKFTNSGRITVTASHGQGQGLVSVSVRDTGTGIPESKFGAIFESFRRLEEDDARTSGGTGLGLNITKQLVELHGGSLTVASEVGKGSVFTFTLAAVQGPEKHEGPTGRPLAPVLPRPLFPPPGTGPLEQNPRPLFPPPGIWPMTRNSRPGTAHPRFSLWTTRP